MTSRSVAASAGSPLGRTRPPPPRAPANARLALALEVVHRGEAPRASPSAAARRRPRAAPRPRARRAPASASSPASSAQSRVALERLDAPRRLLVGGPQVERLASGARRRRGRRGRRRTRRWSTRSASRARLLVVGAEPVGRELEARRRRPGQGARRRAGAACAVASTARRRRSRRARARGGTQRRPGPARRRRPARAARQPGVAREVRHELEVEALAGDRGGLERGAPVVAEVGEAEQHGVAHGVGHDRVVAGGGERRAPRPALAHAPGRAQRPDELLDEERQPLRAMVDARASGAATGPPSSSWANAVVASSGSGSSTSSSSRPARRRSVRRRRSEWPRGTSSER